MFVFFHFGFGFVVKHVVMVGILKVHCIQLDLLLVPM